MKLALMALTIEICLARLFVGSWGWAVLIVVLYCTFVYIRKTISIKKQNKQAIKRENDVKQKSDNGNTKSEKQLYDRYPIGAVPEN